MSPTVISKRCVIGLLLFTVVLTAGDDQAFVDTPQAVKTPAAVKTHGLNEVPTPLSLIARAAATPARPRPQRPQPAPKAGPKREEPGMYLDPSITGAEGCYNADSPALRSALKLPPPKSDSVFVAADLAADIRTLHGFILRNYVLAGELLQRAAHDGHVLGGELSVPNYFDINAFFARWEKAVLAGGRSITFEDGVLRFMKEWRAHVDDEHFGPRIGQIAPTLVEYQAPLRDPIEVTSCKLSAGDARLDTFRMSKTLDENGEEHPILTVSAPALDGPWPWLGSSLPLGRRGAASTGIDY